MTENITYPHTWVVTRSATSNEGDQRWPSVKLRCGTQTLTLLYRIHKYVKKRDGYLPVHSEVSAMPKVLHKKFQIGEVSNLKWSKVKTDRLPLYPTYFMPEICWALGGKMKIFLQYFPLLNQCFASQIVSYAETNKGWGWQPVAYPARTYLARHPV